DRFFVRDQVLDLIDGTVYSCELRWTKPHPEAFRAAMAAVGEDDRPGACSSATGRSTTCTVPRASACGQCSCRAATCRGSRPRCLTPPLPGCPSYSRISTAGNSPAPPERGTAVAG